jgi:hypothetical protein
MNADMLYWIPQVFIYIALAAWSVTLIGLLHHLVSPRTA